MKDEDYMPYVPYGHFRQHAIVYCILYVIDLLLPIVAICGSDGKMRVSLLMLLCASVLLFGALTRRSINLYREYKAYRTQRERLDKEIDIMEKADQTRGTV